MDYKYEVNEILKIIDSSYNKDLDVTYQLSEKAYKLSVDNNYLEGIVKSRYIQGKILLDKGKVNKSIDVLKEAYEAAKQFDDIELLTNIINSIGTANMEIDNYEIALEFFLTGINISGDTNNAIKSKFYLNIGEMYRRLGDFNFAMKYFNQLINQNIIQEDKFIYEIALSNICEISISEKQFDNVLDMLKESLRLAEEIKDVVGQGYIYKIFGRYYEKIGMYKEADKSFCNSLNIFNKTKEGTYIYETVYDYCVMLLSQNREEEAIKILKESFERAKTSNKTKQLQKLSCLIAKAYKKNGNIEESNKYFNLYVDYNEISIKEEKKNRLKGITSQFDLIITQHEKDFFKRKNEELELAYRNLIKINDIVKEVTATQTISEIIRHVYKSLNSIMDVYIFSIGLYDKQTKTICYNSYKEDGNTLKNQNIDINNDNSFSSWVVRNKKDLILLDNSNEKEGKKFVNNNCMISYPDNEEFINSMVILLLEFKGNIIGTMAVKSKEKNAYDKKQLEILKILKSFIAIALNNTKNREKLQKENETRRKIQKELELANQKLYNLSVTDALTTLKNRHYLYNELNNIMKSSTNLNRCLYVIMVDLDHFKEYNDVNGHIAGDKCLEQIGRAFKEISLEYGAEVYRYGGDEFLFTYIPQKGKKGKQLAERIRNSIKEMNHLTICENRVINLTASVGVVKLNPKTDLDISEVLDYVDKALYEAKNRSRDSVKMYYLGNSHN